MESCQDQKKFEVLTAALTYANGASDVHRMPFQDPGNGGEHRPGAAAAACPIYQRRLFLLGDLPFFAGESGST